MAGVVDIANRALTLIGVARITSIDDASTPAAACKTQYDIARQAELRAHLWNFAMARASLPALSTAPAFGWSYAYQYPVDCLRMAYIGDTFAGTASLTDYRGSSEATFALEGRKVLSNDAAPLHVRYVKDLTDTTYFDALFVDALAHRLAGNIAKKLTQSDTQKQALRQDYLLLLAQAIATNAVERPPEPVPDNSWSIARL